MTALAGGSLRVRILTVVLAGAILPLGVAGAWLSRSAVRSAESNLQLQLDSSLAAIASRIDARWSYRRGEFLMMADNAVTMRSLTNAASVSSVDSTFMRDAFAIIGRGIPWIRVHDATGRLRWSFGEQTESTTGGRPFPANLRDEERLPVTLTLRDANGRPIGSAEGAVRLSAVLPLDSMPVLISNAVLSVAEANTGRALSYPGLGSVPPGAVRFERDGDTWLTRSRTIAGAPVTLSIAVPTSAYIGPFKRAERLGLLVLLAVTLLSIGVSLALATRISRPLEQLARAADAVSGGNLEGRVQVDGPGEVRRLSHAFDAMLQTLRQTLQELTQRRALAVAGEFAAGLSHEVRNALTAVRLDLQRVEERAGDETTVRLASRALRHVERLDATVTSALAVARTGHVVPQNVDLTVVLAQAMHGAQGAFDAASASLRLVGEDARPMARGDASALEHLFLNVLMNAAQAVAPGGGAEVHVAREGDVWCVTIRDDGVGMSAAELEALSEPFHSTRRGGTGLGLSLARRIAEAHGGSLAIDSAPGAGTVVRVLVPAALATE